MKRIGPAGKPKPKKKAADKKPRVIKPRVTKYATRIDWDHNQQIISSVFFKIVMREKKMPTCSEIARLTGLSYKTIQRHLQTPSFKRNTEKLRAIQDKMMILFAQQVVESKNHSMWDLYFELTEKDFVKNRRIEFGDKDGQPLSGIPIAAPPWLINHVNKPEPVISKDKPEQ